ncbi:hypothetical protein JHX95_03450 [Staphylococcus saccharolyticus]|uniref:Membrane protein n=1 Tax=Staphylococcus saccharolyticus TaxID=33028 RepID=A0A380H1P7_9STAP|nr:hypothetical protein [Staphylococcus saccharolyticus]MBL7564829.1 hypothetical protein [Staphylococcus saccharolyticus]MBL7570907.1 hypothetical protein [Staphylococcus saccharolyticus]QQB98767.1 hypothetical protein I6I31_01620 [Staphylococcus saccharolyticus]QRJ67018.1 hypothetical protein DMB76_002725 [Staphylococcus saccharolyticus]RTX99820.1 hypothetical protein CD145_00745 [Staphylococcus saccharolyticus]
MQNEVSFGRALKLFWSNYVNFKGRSRRCEYWFAILWNLIFLSSAIIGVFIGFSIMEVGSAYNDEAILGLDGLIFYLSRNLYMYLRHSFLI